MKRVAIYTDGACRGNPGPGGWGVVLQYGASEKCLSGADPETTNNQMELMAVIQALQALTGPCEVVITTDSKYVIQGMTEWLAQWKARGWKTSAKKPVKNVTLWQQLEALVAQHQVSWAWVRGHTGHRENEMADALANAAIDALMAGGCS